MRPLRWTSGLLAGAFALAATAAAAQTATVDLLERTRTHVETLASEAFQGRLTGSEGERLAAAYLVDELTRIGAKPLPGADGYTSPFSFTAGVRDGGSTLQLVREGGTPATFSAPDDVVALSFSDNGEVSGSLVFAGYGIVANVTPTEVYDSYAGLDVEDKIVVVLQYFPEDMDQDRRAALARYSGLRYKAQAARQRGAAGLIIVTGPRSPNAGQTVPMSFDSAIAGSGIVAASVSGRVADAIFEAAGRSLEEVQEGFDKGDPHAQGFEIPGLTVTLAADVQRERRTAHNVLAYLPATEPVDGVAKPWVVIGAHYDHLGAGEIGSSLAGAEGRNRIHYGADDNASGTAAVLAMAEALADEPRRRRHVLIAFWSGEELGLLGSSAFVSEPPVPIDQMAAYLNFDMVGRVSDNRLTVQATGTSDVWPRLLEQANVLAGFDLVLNEDPYQPTDVSSFNGAGVPSLTFFTGAHAEYHRPTDTPDLINYEGIVRVSELATTVVRRLMQADEPPQFVKVERTVETGGRAGLRIFTGTIPDYAAEVEGMLLGGVVGGGPADKAGLQKGDVIVEIAGQSIANIYDYTYALDLLKIGEPVKVVYMRDGERRETTLTPEARR